MSPEAVGPKPAETLLVEFAQLLLHFLSLNYLKITIEQQMILELTLLFCGCHTATQQMPRIQC